MARFALCSTAVLALLTPVAAAIAQSRTTVQSMGDGPLPWTVLIRPSARSVAIGNCQAVYIDLTDATGKDSPRQPGGFRVSIADFDWLANGEQPHGAVGLYNGPSSWSACACPGASIGSSITITATYPAKLLPAKDRVRGVAFQATTQLPISAPNGTSIPKGCDPPEPVVAAAPTTMIVTAPAATIAASPTTPIATTSSPTLLQAPIATLPGSTLPSSARPIATTPTASGPLPPTGIATAPPCTSTPSGLPPLTVTVAGNAAEAVVQWSPPRYAPVAPTGYLVDRTSMTNPTVGHAQSPVLTVGEWRDPLMSSGDWT